MTNTESTVPGRRVIGRILSLGFPLPGPLVDNYNIFSAPSFFDYDALVVDPCALSPLIEGVAGGSIEATTYGGAPVHNFATGPDDVTIAAVLLRRREETQRLLDNGGAMICFAEPPATHATVSGAASLDDYCWLPEDIAGPLRASLIAGDGTQVHVVDYQHPFASFVNGQLANIAYHAHFDARSQLNACTFARSQGGAAVGIELRRERGRVILLPALRALPAGDARYAMSDALQAGIRRALGAIAPGRPPYWLEQHPLPGLDERAVALERARADLETAREAVSAAESAHDEVARYQRLLWQEGDAGLTDVVLDALRLIGCDVYANDRNELELRIDGAPVLVEIEASEHPIDLAPHYRLRQRIERAIERRGEAPRGLLIVNGQRLLPPGERAEISDALRLAAQTMRYAIATTASLFDAVAAALGGDTVAAEALRHRLLTTDGLIER